MSHRILLFLLQRIGRTLLTAWNRTYQYNIQIWKDGEDVSMSSRWAIVPTSENVAGWGILGRVEVHDDGSPVFDYVREELATYWELCRHVKWAYKKMEFFS